jgi:hypothetical protein
MARYRNIRTDWHTHPKTRGLSPLARDLCLQALEANIAGVLERSVRRMAIEAGGRTTEPDVLEAIAELTDPGRPGGPIVAWWPDLEILWLIEAADEQAKNDKAWKSVIALVLGLPIPVRVAFANRYRNTLSLSEAPHGPTVPDPETVPESAPEPCTHAPKPEPSTDSPRGPDPKAELRNRAAQIAGPAGEKARLVEWRTYGGDPDGLGPWPAPQPPHGPALAQLTLAKADTVLASGRTAQDVHRLVHRLGAMVAAGAFPPTEHRAQYVFSGFFESVEQRAAEWAERVERPPEAPIETSAADAFLEAMRGIGGDA